MGNGLGAFAAVVTLAVSAATWGGLDAPPVSHDGASYLLQSRIFASGHWKAPAPPLPEFFEQYHVLVTPVLASKYPPGQALLLVPGSMVSLPGLVPLLLSALTAFLLVVLIAPRWGRRVAMITWAVWLLAPLGMHFRPTYLSEVSTAFLWAGGWWCLARWWAGKGDRYLVALAATVGWMAITRPLTAVAYAIPLAVVVLGRVWRERRWGAIGAAVASGTAVLALLPIWSRMTTGSWTRTPLAIYAEQYMPWDRIGFGLDSTPPLRAGPPGMDRFAEQYRQWHRDFTPAGAARAAWARAKRLAREAWGGAAAFTLFLALVGLKVPDRRLALGIAQAGLLLLLYGFYAHGVAWNAYYLEALPVFSLMPVLGLYWLDGRAVAGGPPREAWLLPVGGSVLVALMAGAAMQEYNRAGVRREPYMRLRRALAEASVPAVVLVRRPADHSYHVQLVVNEPDMAEVPVWLAHDLGERNGRLLERAGGRAAYVFDEPTGTQERMPGGP